MESLASLFVLKQSATILLVQKNRGSVLFGLTHNFRVNTDIKTQISGKYSNLYLPHTEIMLRITPQIQGK